jgi:hypothetical protein
MMNCEEWKEEVSNKLRQTSSSSSCSCQWGKTMSLNCGHKRAYSSSARWYMSMGSHGGMILTEKPVAAPLCLPQIPHGSHPGLSGARPATNRVREVDVLFQHLPGRTEEIHKTSVGTPGIGSRNVYKLAATFNANYDIGDNLHVLYILGPFCDFIAVYVSWFLSWVWRESVSCINPFKTKLV